MAGYNVNKTKSKKIFLHNLLFYSFSINLPLYFVLDATNKFWGWIPGHSSLQVLGIAIVSMLLLFFLLKFFLLKEKAQVLLIWMTLGYFYFKTIKDWLVVVGGFQLLSSYGFYITFLLLLSGLFFFVIRKLSFQRVQKMSLYLNIVFPVLMLVELAKFGYNYANKQTPHFTTAKVDFNSLAQKKYPDVFILQFDEYAGLQTLKNMYGFDNSKFVDALKRRSFQIAQNSNSNYNGTSFSVLSLLNMGYIEEITKAEVSSAIAYSKSVEAIRKNDLMHFFRSNGYNVYNHSFFEVEQTRSLNYLFLPVKQRLMLDKTFGSVLLNDLVCSVNSNTFHLLINDYPARIDKYNQEVIKRSFETISAENAPVFMYAHFMMPHSPFLRDSTGGLKNIGQAYKESNKGLNIKSYLQYLNYCNKVALEMIDSIKRSKPNSVIVIMSDHGLRNLKQSDRKHSEFNNFIAISSPKHENTIVPDSLCTVNLFRSIMNQHFGQNFPMLDNRKINVNMALKE
jgi:hypothetical protein